MRKTSTFTTQRFNPNPRVGSQSATLAPNCHRCSLLRHDFLIWSIQRPWPLPTSGSESACAWNQEHVPNVEPGVALNTHTCSRSHLTPHVSTVEASIAPATKKSSPAVAARRQEIKYCSCIELGLCSLPPPAREKAVIIAAQTFLIPHATADLTLESPIRKYSASGRTSSNFFNILLHGIHGTSSYTWTGTNPTCICPSPLLKERSTHENPP